jgi:hypothetical protein
MGQVLKQDKVGLLSESGGTITLAPSTLTIGGQQYSTSSLNVAATVDSAHTRYFIYAIRNAGSTILTISENVNSVGPAGEAAWKLVGAYYTDDAPGFGSFVNIEGKPISSPIAFNIELTAEVITPTRGGTPTEEAHWQIDGAFMYIDWTYRHQTAGVAGSGAYILRVPFNFAINTSNIITLSDPNIIVPTTMGRAYVHLAASPINAHLVVRNDSSPRDLIMRVLPGTDAFWGNTVHSMGNVNLSAGFNGRIPIQELSDTPLKDL